MSAKTHRYSPALPFRRERSSGRWLDPNKSYAIISRRAFTGKRVNCSVKLPTLDAYENSQFVLSQVGRTQKKLKKAPNNNKKRKEKLPSPGIEPMQINITKPFELKHDENLDKPALFSKTTSNEIDSGYAPLEHQENIHCTNTFESVGSFEESVNLDKIVKLKKYEYEIVSSPKYLSKLSKDKLCYILSNNDDITETILEILDRFKQNQPAKDWGTYKILAFDSIFNPASEILKPPEKQLFKFESPRESEHDKDVIYKSSRLLNLKKFDQNEKNKAISLCFEKLNSVVEDKGANLIQILNESIKEFDDYFTKIGLDPPN